MGFIELGWQAWFTVAVIIAMFAALLLTKIRTDVAFLAAITALYASGVLDISGAFGGFSSESVLVVGVLYVVIAGLTHTGVLNWIVKNVMGVPKTLSGAMARLMLPVAFLSSLLSNTTVVALFINVVRMWSKKLNISPSKLLIPLSYASGMGGICTLIGTPPNLIISGLYAEETGIGLSIFTTTLCGLFCLTVGILSMIAMQKLLPERHTPIEQVNTDDFTAEMTVKSNNSHIGMQIDEIKTEIGWPGDDTKLLAIRRFDNEIVEPVPDDEFLMGGDRLLICGKASTLIKLSHKLELVAPQLDGILENEGESCYVKPYKTILSTLILISMVLLSAFKVLPMFTACLLAAAAMIATGCCTSEQGMKSINWEIIVTFMGSVAIGKAIQSTGIAQLIANGLLDVCGTNPYIVLGVMCLVATFITEFISNTAAGAMFYPIAMSSATMLGVNPLTFCVALMISASSSFATPIGSPTHMLVYSPGNYRFQDFAKVGIPMNFIILFANIFITPIVFPF